MRALPRPSAEMEFAERLLRAIVSGRTDWEALDELDHGVWRRLYYVGGALGAAALAITAALGWRRVRVFHRGETSGRAA